MKPGLQRIESTLNQLQNLPVATASGIISSATTPPSPIPALPVDFPSVTLPTLYPSTSDTHCYAADPLLTISLLKEMEGMVSRWHSELQTVLLKIQDVYLEGPVVDGWLESGEIEPTELPPASDRPLQVHLPQDTPLSNRATYRLCGLDAEGRSWSRPCAPAEIPYLSLAIARSHKLQQLLQHKQTLELRLSRLSQDLIEVHSRL